MRPNVAPSRRRVTAAAVAATAVALALAGCSDPAVAPDDPLGHKPGQLYFYGTDGNMMNSIGDLITPDHPEAVSGMKGTTPLTPLSQSFRERLRSVDATLVDDTYTGETYDAVVISALAAQIAGTTDPRAIAAQINGVTVGGELCDTPAQCLDLIDAGRDIRYRGITLGLGGFTDAGEPSAATYGILRFGSGNHLATSLTQFLPTGNPATAAATTPPAGEGSRTSSKPLRIGALLPHTGALSSAGPPMFAAGRLAIKEINDAGGVLGRPVEWVDGDDGTNADVAKATVNRLINEEHVDVIIGAGASGISLAVLPLIREAGVVMFSPCNTSAELSTADDDGLYFRTAPPDNLQANALADIIVRDGTRSLAIIYRDDSYGAGLAEATKRGLVSAGLSADGITMLPYTAEPLPADHTATAEAVKQADPDGVLLISFDETSAIVDALVRAGVSSITN